MALELETVMVLDEFTAFPALFGNLDAHMKRIERAFRVSVSFREGNLQISGSPDSVRATKEVITELIKRIESGDAVDAQTVNYVIESVSFGEGEHLEAMGHQWVCTTAKGRHIKAKTLGQEVYVKAIQDKELVFGIGPAGTGKTYLAVAMAIRALKQNIVQKIIITRPAVEAGESLGFLPGDLQMKVDPYLRPLYDALLDILGAESFTTYRDRGIIEIAPLAYMRGRTLDNAFIILDEAQNTTKEQMKMFLTRFGFNSRAVVNGDTSQVDLPSGKRSGLIHALEVLRDVPEIACVHLTDRDVVRHELVKKIIRSYDAYDRLKRGEHAGRDKGGSV